VNVRHSPGAAGTVVSNLAALGAGEVIPIGFTGDDGEGYELREDLAALGCRMGYLFRVPERRTPVYLKPRDITVPGLEGERERYDTKNREPLPADLEAKILQALEEMLPKVDAVVIADQVEEEDCGVITVDVRGALSEMADAYPEVVFWADSRRRIGLFHNVITKPNQREAVTGAFPSHEGPFDGELVLNAGRALRIRTGKPVFVTCGERGILVFDQSGWREVRGVRVEGPMDSTGAGDAATAAAVLTLAGGGELEEAALMANLAASITIEQLGVTGAASPEDLPARLDLWRLQV